MHPKFIKCTGMVFKNAAVLCGDPNRDKLHRATHKELNTIARMKNIIAILQNS